MMQGQQNGQPEVNTGEWSPTAVVSALKMLGRFAGGRGVKRDDYAGEEVDYFEGYGNGERWGQRLQPHSKAFYERVGREAWNMLHQAAASYPDDPTPKEQRAMYDFIVQLGRLYPCETCAVHIRQTVERHPPAVGSRKEISLWMCRMHNSVNARLGKPIFKCSLNNLDTQYSTPATSSVASARASANVSGVASAANGAATRGAGRTRSASGMAGPGRPLDRVSMGKGRNPNGLRAGSNEDTTGGEGPHNGGGFNNGMVRISFGMQKLAAVVRYCCCGSGRGGVGEGERQGGGGGYIDWKFAKNKRVHKSKKFAKNEEEDEDGFACSALSPTLSY